MIEETWARKERKEGGNRREGEGEEGRTEGRGGEGRARRTLPLIFADVLEIL